MPDRLNWDPTTHYQDVEVAERYDRERFSSLPGRVFDSLEKAALRRAFRPFSRSLTVVDLPSGTGRLAETLLEDGFDVTGVDISGAMLEVAKRKLQRFGDRYRSIVADVHELAKAQPKSFDVALCARVLMHFPIEEQVRFVASVARLSRSHVVLTQSLNSPYQRLRREAKKLLGNAPPAGYPIDESELSHILFAAGLCEERRYRPLAPISEAMIVVARIRQS